MASKNVRNFVALATSFALLTSPLSAEREMATSQASSSSASADKRIGLVKILDNTGGMEALNQAVGIERFERLLQDSGQGEQYSLSTDTAAADSAAP